MGNSNHTLKMANTDNFLEIINDNQKKTRLPNLYAPHMLPQTDCNCYLYVPK